MSAFRAVGRRLGCGLLLAFVVTSGAAAEPRSPSAGLLRPPVTPACISSPYGPRVLPGKPLAGTFHHGIDLPAPEGAPVRAAAAGQIIRVQENGPGGLEVLIQHAGFIGVYSHLGSIDPLIVGGRLTVRAGQTIGTVGRTGITYGMHLYFGMIVDGHSVDPAPLLSVTACDGSTTRRTTATAGQGTPSATASRLPPFRTIVSFDGKVLPTRRYLGG